ncbi:MAG: response regulator [Anaerolineae bacterium]|nr:response regulator [Anaerolineae bacterium]MDW8067881.1 response regulator [Anaerolineae bacterium]
MPAKILIVEDDLESLKLIGLMLQNRGYQIIAAQNGPQALSKAVNESPDLVLLDVMMPGMDGYEVARRLRADARTASLPIIMLTARGQVTDKVAGFEAGADEYLVKPVHPAELVTRIEALLARSARLGPPVHVPRGKSIGFLGCKGGVGTSTLAVNLGVALIRGPASGKRAILIDIRTGSSTLALQMGLRPQRGLQVLAERDPAGLTADTILTHADRHATGMLVLGGLPEPSGVVPSFTPTHAEALVRALAGELDYVLIDMGTGLEEVNRTLLRFLHYVVVVVEPTRLGLLLAQGLLGMLDTLEVGRHRQGVALVNRAPTSMTPGKDTVEEFLGREIIGIIPPAPELAFQAAERGVPMVMLQPESVVAVQFNHLAQYIASR